MGQLSDEGDTALSSYYEGVLSKLRFKHVEGVSEFFGGPLNLGNGCSDWVSPAEIIDEYGKQQYHIIYLNTNPSNDNSGVPVTLLRLDEMALKLASEADARKNIVAKLLNSTTPRIIIRPTSTGMLYYPSASLPTEDKENLIFERTDKTLEALGLGPIVEITDLRFSKAFAEIVPLSGGVSSAGEQVYTSDFGDLIVTSYILNNDTWKYYQVISSFPLAGIDRSRVVPMRLDSGCDIGQIYRDLGCDCSDQLHRAIEKTISDGGIIIHLPTQDGRGYGMVTKMETEGLKSGVQVVTNSSNLVPMDTIEAAKSLLGEAFDIRTYLGVGRLLNTLGIDQVQLYTNNRKKIAGLERMGIGVTRLSAVGNPDNIHVKAKLAHGDIYIKD